MLSAAQLAERTKYLGGSDAASVVGMSRWSSPLKVWAEKVGVIVADEKEKRFELELGTLLEDDVVSLYERETGRKVVHEPRTQFHPAYPFIAVNLDGRLDADTDFEAKIAAYVKAEEWKDDEIPGEYILQGQHSMGVTGKHRHVIACLLLGGGVGKFVHKVLYRDDEIIKELFAREVKFWRTYVEPRRRPPQITRLDSDVLLKLFPREDNGAPAVLDDAADRLADSREALLRDKRALKSEIDRVSNELRALLGDRSWGKTARFKISWRNEARVEFDTDALKRALPDVYARFAAKKDMRVLRVTERRGGRR